MNGYAIGYGVVSFLFGLFSTFDLAHSPTAAIALAVLAVGWAVLALTAAVIGHDSNQVTITTCTQKEAARLTDIQRVFDRREHWDERNLAHLVADHFDTGMPLRARQWTRTFGVLDQGDVPGCTGWAAATLMAETPRPRLMTNADGLALYQEAQREDEWPGEDYLGSSVLGAMRALKTKGDISGYWWATNADQVAHAVAYLGPVEIGVNWRSGMMRPTGSGNIYASGLVVGGHAVTVSGIRTLPGSPYQGWFVRIDNSWGETWGINGSAWLPLGDLDVLLADKGDAALPKKVKL